MSAYAKTLDKSRHHGSIHPPHQGAFFQQDGLFFDHEGYLVDALLTDEQKARLKKKSAVKASSQSKQPPNPASGQQAVDDGAGGKEGDGDEDKKEPDDGLNLSAWLKGDADYQTRDVQNTIKARYSKNCTKIVDMVEFLVAEGIAAKGELKPEFKKLLGEAE